MLRAHCYETVVGLTVCYFSACMHCCSEL